MAILSSGWAFAFLIFSTHLINFSALFPSGLSLLPQGADSLFLLEPQELLPIHPCWSCFPLAYFAAQGHSLLLHLLEESWTHLLSKTESEDVKKWKSTKLHDTRKPVSAGRWITRMKEQWHLQTFKWQVWEALIFYALMFSWFKAFETILPYQDTRCFISYHWYLSIPRTPSWFPDVLMRSLPT